MKNVYFDENGGAYARWRAGVRLRRHKRFAAQNLGGGRIHFARAFLIAEGWSGRREQTQKGRHDFRHVFLFADNDTADSNPPSSQAANQRKRLQLENEEQGSERTMSFYKKLAASVISLATSGLPCIYGWKIFCDSGRNARFSSIGLRYPLRGCCSKYSRQIRLYSRLSLPRSFSLSYFPFIISFIVVLNSAMSQICIGSFCV